jgi:chromosome segregation ATPase
MDIQVFLAIVGLILSSAVSAYEVISKAKLKKQAVHVRVQDKELENLQELINTWRDQCRLITADLRDTQIGIRVLREERDNLHEQVRTFELQARTATENLRDQLRDEQVQRKKQAAVIIELTEKLDKTNKLIMEQAEVIAELRKTQHIAREENSMLKKKLFSAESRIKVLEAALEVKGVK